MPLFPTTPIDGQIVYVNGTNYLWSDTRQTWKRVLANALSAGTSTGSGTGSVTLYSANAFVSNFVGTGSQSVFPLSGNIAVAEQLIVHVNGIYQIPRTNFTANSQFIIFDSPPDANAEIVVQAGITGSGGGGATVTISSTAPTGTDGALWLDEDSARLAVYIAGGWVEVGGSSSTFTANDFVTVGGLTTTGNVSAGRLLASTGVYSDNYFYANGSPIVIGVGATGATGAVGATGAAGVQGATGIQGNIGATGATGIQGNIGATGATGIQGNIGPVGGPTYAVTNSGASAYTINGASNPTINLLRGFTYYFSVSAAGHPFWIKTDPITGTGNAWTSGVTNNGIDSGTVTFAVPFDAPATLYYICQFHGSMVGTLAISDVGPQGATGATGTAGATGASGIAGNIGATGATGAIGATGPAGTGGSANIAILDEGVEIVSAVTSLNFVGAGITANAVGSNVTITVTATGNVSGNIGGNVTTYNTIFNIANATTGFGTPVINDAFTANGSQTQFSLSANVSAATDLLVTVDTVLQRPGTNYTLNGNLLNFAAAPTANAVVGVRTFGNYSSAAGFVNQFTGNGTTANYALSGATVSSTSLIVFVDGVYQIPDVDFTLSGTTVTFTEAPDANSNITIQSLNNTLRDNVVVAGIVADNMSPPTVGTVPAIIDSFSTSIYRSAKYVISVSNNTQFQAAEALLVHDNANVQLVTYGIVYTGAAALISFTANIVSNNVCLYGTGVGSGNVVKLQKTYVKV